MMPAWRRIFDQAACSSIRKLGDLLGVVPQFHAWWHLLIFLAAMNTAGFLGGLTCFEEGIPPRFWRLEPLRRGVGVGLSAIADDWILDELGTTQHEPTVIDV